MEHEGIVLELLPAILGFLLLASAAAVGSRKLRFPYTILLVIIGLFIGWARGHMEFLEFFSRFELTPEIVLFVFLPVLLFDSAFNLDARSVLKNALPIALLAVPALLLSSMVVGVLVHFTLGLPLDVALLFGALISATDPVAVVALFKDMGAPKRLHLLVEGESLFNDGTALVVFRILLAVVLAGRYGPETVVEGVASFLLVAAGGIATGVVMGFLFSKIIEFVDNDRFVEITLTTILAHSAFFLAEHLAHVSGVMATVAAGLTLGSYGRTKISPEVLGQMESFWDYFANVSNSLIFLLVGLSIELGLFFDNLPAILTAAVAVLLGRAFAVFGLFPLLRLLRISEPVNLRFQTVIVWGGLRGALAIVMALSIPASLKQRPFILVLTLGVVLFSLLVNGLSVKRLMHWLGLDRYSRTERLERLQAMIEVKNETLDWISEYADQNVVNPGVLEHARRKYRQSAERLSKEYDKLRRSVEPSQQRELEFRHCLASERHHYRRLFEEGILGERGYIDMQTAIQRQLDRLREGKEIYRSGTLPLSMRLTRLIERLPGAGPLTSRLKTHRIALRYELERARFLVSSQVLEEISHDRSLSTLSETTTEEARSLYGSLHEKARRRIEQMQSDFPEYVERTEDIVLERLCLRHEMERYNALHKQGHIDEKILQERTAELEDRLRSLKPGAVGELTIEPSELLALVPSFSQLGREKLRELALRAHARSFLPEETIVRQDQEGSSLFLIGRGRVAVYDEGTERKEKIAELGPGDFFGETALLHPQPRTATVKALTPCTLLELEGRRLRPLLEDFPALKDNLEEANKRRNLSNALGRCPALKTLTPRERDFLSSKMHFIYLQKSHEPETDGDNPLAFGIVLSGEIYLKTPEGKELKLSAQNCFRNQTIEPITDTELAALYQHDLPDIKRRNPALIKKLDEAFTPENTRRL